MPANIQSLTALRGLAALAVLAFHAAAPLCGGADRVPMPFNRGYLAVDLFFLLSGFVLMHVHEKEFRDGVAWAGFKSFLRARFARTYPVHLVTLLMLLPLYGTQPEFSGVALVHNLLFTQGPWFGMSWNYGAWSVSAEWHAYLLFPFLVMPWHRRSKRVIVVLLVLCAAVLGVAIVGAGNYANITSSPSVLLRCLPEFIAGTGLYRVYREGWLERWIGGDFAAAAAAIAVVGLASFAGTDVAVIVAFAFLLLACAHNRGRAARVLATRAPMYLGRVSYSLYMVQMGAAFVLSEIARHWLGSIAVGGAWDAAAFTALSFAFAIPLSRYVEYPMRDWLRGRAKRPAASIHMLAAVDGQGRAGDEPALVGDQK